jgi:hypothetical protein
MQLLMKMLTACDSPYSATDKIYGYPEDIKIMSYQSPYDAITDGWRLIGPPETTRSCCKWWFEKIRA